MPRSEGDTNYSAREKRLVAQYEATLAAKDAKIEALKAQLKAKDARAKELKQKRTQ